MEAYCNAVRRLEDKFDGLELNHVPRKYNEDADELAKIASGRTTVPPHIFARYITKPSIEFKDPAEPGPSNAGPSGGNPPADEVEPMDIDFEILHGCGRSNGDRRGPNFARFAHLVPRLDDSRDPTLGPR